MKPYIKCEKSGNGNLVFYMNGGNKSYFLFCQKFRKSIYEFCSKGIPLDDALNFARAKRDKDVLHLIERLPSVIRYVEKEEDISVLRNTIKKNNLKVS